MSRGPDAGTSLERALVAAARHAGCSVAVVAGEWCRWASATFTGARHAIVVEGSDDAPLAGWLAGLADADLPLGRYLLADLGVRAVTRTAGTARIELEALTVEQ